MNEQTNNRIREEFKEFFKKEVVGSDLILGWVIKWWLSKIDELLKLQREELVEKIKEQKIIDDEFTEEDISDFEAQVRSRLNRAYDKFLSIIKEDK